MSSQRGNVKKGAPKHLNSFAFRHNPKSKKTDKILAMPIRGLCDKCHAQIEWRKKYRKYKPLTKPGSCSQCHQKTVTSAYHVVCNGCAKDKNICAKCCLSKDLVPSNEELKAEREEKEKEFEAELDGMRERERRAHLRRVRKEQEALVGGGDVEDDFDIESFSDEELADS